VRRDREMRRRKASDTYNQELRGCSRSLTLEYNVSLLIPGVPTCFLIEDRTEKYDPSKKLPGKPAEILIGSPGVSQGRLTQRAATSLWL
jgi:hypothetical protein